MISHGLETTVAEYEALPTREQKKISKKFIDLYEKSPLYVMTDNDKLIIAHAGIRKDYIEKQTKKLKLLSFMEIFQEQSIQTDYL